MSNRSHHSIYLPRRMIFVGLLLGVVQLCPATISLEQLIEQVRKHERVVGSYAGTETNLVSRNNMLGPGPDTHVSLESAMDGKYRWYVSGNDWWTVKEIAVQPSAGQWPGLRYSIHRNYDGRILQSEHFERTNGKRYFLSAHLDNAVNMYSIGPMLGRRYGDGRIVKLLEELTDIQLNEIGKTIEVLGIFRKLGKIRLVFDPSHDYLATSYRMWNGPWEDGYVISKLRKAGAAWFPEEAERFGGEYLDTPTGKWYRATIRYSDFRLHGKPSDREVASIPAGSILGSEESRLYRMRTDGTLQDFGRMGQKPGKPLAWGDLFVLSGAGILISSLSWLVFRKRRSSPSLSRR